MADPKILYWVSGIVVCLLALWVVFVNLRLESRGQGAKGPSGQVEKKKQKEQAEKEEEEDDEDE